MQPNPTEPTPKAPPGGAATTSPKGNSVPRKKWRSKVVSFLVLAGIAGLIFYGFMPRPVLVEMGKVERGIFALTVNEEGKTRIKQKYVVASPLSGLLQRIPLKAGAQVEANVTVLAMVEPNPSTILDPRTRGEAEARIRTAEAAIEQARANQQRIASSLQFAKTNLERAKTLLKEKVIAQSEFDEIDEKHATLERDAHTAETAFTVSTFELEQARAALDQGRTGGGQPYKILSPVTGQVLRVLQESETAVKAGQDLLEVGDAGDLEVVVDVLSRDAVRMGPGTKMLLEQWGGGEPLEARVRLVEPSGFTKISALGVEEQRVNIVADIVTPVAQRRMLGDAFRVEARIFVREDKDVAQVPSNALFRHGEAWAVYEVVSDKATLRTVRIGENNGIRAEVLEGLSDGTKVILNPSDKLSDGQWVGLREIR